MNIKESETRIAVVGLGYVGLPLAVLFSSPYRTTGFDLDLSRVEAINKGTDANGELSRPQIEKAFGNGFRCTAELKDIRDCNVYIVAVPTPVDNNNIPDLSPLKRASSLVGEVISKDDIVIFESTVYPGVTEEECIPIIEHISGLKLNVDFMAGYSPERINPGDKTRPVETIVKVVSGSCDHAADRVEALYSSVLKKGVYRAPSIRVAEASKIMENSQRDVNIAFMNEMAKIFNAMKIDTQEVIRAASTKWNFMHFSPGLVGGHCISVDPYYLIQKALVYGVYPRIMSAARSLNDGMGNYVAAELVRLMNLKGIMVRNAHILILGFTFKEDCPDIRNTKVVDIYTTLAEYTDRIEVCDPFAGAEEVESRYGIKISASPPEGVFDAIVLAVGHSCFKNIDVKALRAENSAVYDVKSFFDRSLVDARL